MVFIKGQMFRKIRVPFCRPRREKKLRKVSIFGLGLGSFGNFMIMVSRCSAEGGFGKEEKRTFWRPNDG